MLNEVEPQLQKVSEGNVTAEISRIELRFTGRAIFDCCSPCVTYSTQNPHRIRQMLSSSKLNTALETIKRDNYFGIDWNGPVYGKRPRNAPCGLDDMVGLSENYLRFVLYFLWSFELFGPPRYPLRDN